MKTIVAGTDFNALATAALRFAGEIAERSGAELIVVYADAFEPPVEFTATQLPNVASAIERARRSTLDQLRAHVAKHVSPNVVWRAIVADGAPATAISAIAEAQGADFIVVGTHGRGGLQRLVLGSVAEALMRDAHVPVLTVRSTNVPPAVAHIVALPGSRAAATEIASAVGAEVAVVDVANVVEADGSGAYDLIVIAADEVNDPTAITRHANTPVLTVAHVAVPASGSR